MRMTRLLGVCFALLLASAAFGQNFDHAQYFPKATPAKKSLIP